jgi:hypothetical protein
LVANVVRTPNNGLDLPKVGTFSHISLTITDTFSPIGEFANIHQETGCIKQGN